MTAVSSAEMVRLVQNAKVSQTERGTDAALAFMIARRASPPGRSQRNMDWNERHRLGILKHLHQVIA